jgi:hypothetical protein
VFLKELEVRVVLETRQGRNRRFFAVFMGNYCCCLADEIDGDKFAQFSEKYTYVEPFVFLACECRNSHAAMTETGSK